MQSKYPATVFVDVDEWNEIVKRLEEKIFSVQEFHTLARAYQLECEGYETGTMEELKARMAERDERLRAARERNDLVDYESEDKQS